MEFGLNFEKLILIGVVAVLLVGPERLPRYAESFARLMRRAGEFLRDTRTRVREEMGPEVDEVDWRKLDPRQYDPRRIIRDALFDEPTPAGARTATATKPVSAAMPDARPAERARRDERPVFSAQAPPPFDAEAT